MANCFKISRYYQVIITYLLVCASHYLWNNFNLNCIPPWHLTMARPVKPDNESIDCNSELDLRNTYIDYIKLVKTYASSKEDMDCPSKLCSFNAKGKIL